MPNWGAIVSRRVPMEKRRASPNWEEADAAILWLNGWVLLFFFVWEIECEF
jgi:hypothetical protein